MRVILKSDVPNLGRAGDEKVVKDGYARNYLIPRNLVIQANARSVKEREFLKKMQERKIQKRKKTAEELSASLNGKAITIVVKTGDEGKLFGSVTNMHIQRALEAENVLVDKKVIILDDIIKQLGKYDIPLKLYEGVECKIHLTVQDEDGNTEPQVPEVAEEEPEEVFGTAESSVEETNEATEENSEQLES